MTISLNTRTRRYALTSGINEHAFGWTINVRAFSTALTLNCTRVDGYAVLHLTAGAESVAKLEMRNSGEIIHFFGERLGSLDAIDSDDVHHVVAGMLAMYREIENIQAEAEALVAARLAA